MTAKIPASTSPAVRRGRSRARVSPGIGRCHQHASPSLMPRLRAGGLAGLHREAAQPRAISGRAVTDTVDGDRRGPGKVQAWVIAASIPLTVAYCWMTCCAAWQARALVQGHLAAAQARRVDRVGPGPGGLLGQVARPVPGR